jgi:hypothetical protein
VGREQLQKIADAAKGRYVGPAGEGAGRWPVPVTALASFLPSRRDFDDFPCSSFLLGVHDDAVHCGQGRRGSAGGGARRTRMLAPSHAAMTKNYVLCSCGNKLLIEPFLAKRLERRNATTCTVPPSLLDI